MTTETCSLRPVPMALSLGSFLVVGYLACLTLSLIVPDRELHSPWLQFYPGFSWTWQGMLIGLVESFAYGFVSGLVFAPIFNFFNGNR